MDIRNREGEVILKIEAAKGTEVHTACFMDMELGDAVFDGHSLVNAHFEGAILRNASFRNCDLYWAAFADALATGADFRRRRYRGGRTLRERILNRHVSTARTWAATTLNGPTSCLASADLDGASVEGTIFKGATTIREQYSL